MAASEKIPSRFIYYDNWEKESDKRMSNMGYDNACIY